MAISTYAELQTAIDNLLKLNGSAEFSSRIPEWISLAESEINRSLRVFKQEEVTTETYQTTDTDRTITLSFVEILHVDAKKSSEAATEFRNVRYVPPDQFNSRTTADAGVPVHYTVRKGDLIMDRLASEDTDVRIHYIKTWDIATDTTNWLLTNYPDVYLYGAAYHGAMYRENYQKADIYKGVFERAMSSANMVSERSRDDAELDVTELGVVSAQRNHSYDVITDDYRN